MVQNFYGGPPPPSEEHHEAIEYIQTTLQVTQAHIYELEGLEQANSVLTSTNSTVMTQLAKMTVTMNVIQAQFDKYMVVLQLLGVSCSL